MNDLKAKTINAIWWAVVVIEVITLYFLMAYIL